MHQWVQNCKDEWDKEDSVRISQYFRFLAYVILFRLLSLIRVPSRPLSVAARGFLHRYYKAALGARCEV